MEQREFELLVPPCERVVLSGRNSRRARSRKRRLLSGPSVRISLPPAASLRTIIPSVTGVGWSIPLSLILSPGVSILSGVDAGPPPDAISAHCSPRPLGPSAAVTTKGSGRCPVPRRLPSAAASHLSSSGAMLRTSDDATRSITGHVSPPSAIPSVAPDILRCANAATRTVVLSVVSRIDCLPWRVSFCSDRRCLIRTLADLPHNGAIIHNAPKPRVATIRFLCSA
jgi:hypothetical protein